MLVIEFGTNISTYSAQYATCLYTEQIFNYDKRGINLKYIVRNNKIVKFMVTAESRYVWLSCHHRCIVQE